MKLKCSEHDRINNSPDILKGLALQNYYNLHDIYSLTPTTLLKTQKC